MNDDEVRRKAAEGLGWRKSLAGWLDDNGVTLPTDIDGWDLWEPLTRWDHAMMLWEYSQKDWIVWLRFLKAIGAEDDGSANLLMDPNALAQLTPRRITEAFVASLPEPKPADDE